MALIAVLDGLGLDSAVRRIQRQCVLYYPDVVERDRDIPTPWPGATVLIGGVMRMESWDEAISQWVSVGGTVDSLDDLDDVTIANLQSGMVLRWNGAQWVPTLLLLDDIADVFAPTPSEGQVLTFTGGSWKNATPAAGGVPTSRLINTTLPLTGGGSLAADLTLAVNAATTAANGVVRLADGGDFILLTPGRVAEVNALSAAMRSGFGGGAGSPGTYIAQQVNVKNSGGALAIADAGCLVTVNSATPQTVTIPAGVFLSGTPIDVAQLGTGTVTITPAATQTLNGGTVGIPLTKQYAKGCLRLISANTWLLTEELLEPTSGSPSITTPLIIPDPVGTSYPALRFDAGDGGNGTGPNPYHYEWNLYNDRLRLFSNRQPSTPLAEFARPATDVAEMALQDWSIIRDSDGYLRFYQGASHAIADNDFTVGAGGNIWAAGTGSIGTVVATGGVVKGNGANLTLNYNATSYCNISGRSDKVSCLVGHAPYYGDYSKVGINCQPEGNGAEHRPISLHKNAGPGEVGLGFLNHVTGWTSAFQMHNDGAIYIGHLNGVNTAYVKSYAAAFTVISTRRFKADIEPTPGSALAVVEAVRPVRYRDLQHEMALEATARNIDGSEREPPVIVPQFRWGLVAEEVQAVAPEVAPNVEHGPGLDLSGLVAVLWQAVRELSARVRQLEGSTA